MDDAGGDGSVASTVGLLNSPSAWRSVSSWVSWRSVGPMSSSSAEDEKELK